ncbi:MAG: PAS domain-containing protein, partial [Verrucomicrobiales bacterium]|nr:PAS domain-containing protein [Verrucomicrobiales bacterium]
MRMPRFICGLPIRHKLTLLLLAPGLVVMGLGVAGLVGLQVHLFRADYIEDVTTVGNIVAANCTAAVAFDDPVVAAEILGSVRDQEYVTGAILVRPDGSVMASYGTHKAPPQVASATALTFDGSTALLVKPVVADGKQLATLNLSSDYHAFVENVLSLVGGMLVLVMLVGTAVAVVLSSWLQKLVSDPILRLAGTAQSVAEDHDYSVRAHVEDCAELGALTRAFNSMLARIEDQESALKDSQGKLESLIHSIHGVVWEADVEGDRLLFVSQQAETMLGYPVSRWLETPGFRQSLVHPDDKTRVLETYRRSIAEGKPFQVEYRVAASDGRSVWIRESVAIRHEQGRPDRLRGLLLDISDQRAAAEQLERANRRLVEVSRLAGMAEVATGIL